MIGLFGAQFMVPIFLQQVMGFTPFQAGLIIVPALIVSGLSGVVSGRLNDLISPAAMAMVRVYRTHRGVHQLCHGHHADDCRRVWLATSFCTARACFPPSPR